MTSCTIDRFPETLAMVRLGPGTDVPGWAESSSVFAVTATATETTLVCAGRNVPGKARAIKPLTAFVVREPGPEARSVTTAGLVLAAAEVEVHALVLDTFEHPWLLVPADQANTVEEEWRRRGHRAEPAIPAHS